MNLTVSHTQHDSHSMIHIQACWQQVPLSKTWLLTNTHMQMPLGATLAKLTGKTYQVIAPRIQVSRHRRTEWWHRTCKWVGTLLWVLVRMCRPRTPKAVLAKDHFTQQKVYSNSLHPPFSQTSPAALGGVDPAHQPDHRGVRRWVHWTEGQVGEVAWLHWNGFMEWFL